MTNVERFSVYVNKYNLKDKNIMSKYKHSLRVMELSVKYAKLLGFSEEDVKLAEVIGLLHDYARFEQIKVYNSFHDTMIFDHALEAVDYLFRDGEIKKYWNKEEDYELIKFAILNHNKYSVKKTTNARYLKFANLIRDVDKLDIFKVIMQDFKIKENLKEIKIKRAIVRDIKNNKLIAKELVDNGLEGTCILFSYVFDVNNEVVLKDMKKLVDELYNTYKVKQLEEIYNYVSKYLIERIDF